MVVAWRLSGCGVEAQWLWRGGSMDINCFHVLAFINSVAVDSGLHVLFSIMVFSGYMPSSGITGSYSSFIPSF